LARAMFQAADQKVREKQLKKSRRIIWILFCQVLYINP
jgi:hypothetical protein